MATPAAHMGSLRPSMSSGDPQPAAHTGSLRPSMGSADPQPASVCKRNFWGLSHRRSSVIAPLQEGPGRHSTAGPLQQCASLGPGRHSTAGSLQQPVSGTAAIPEVPGRRSAAATLQQRPSETAPRWGALGRYSLAGGRRPKASLLAGLRQETISEGASPSSSQDARDELPVLHHGSTAVELEGASCADGEMGHQGGVAQVEPGSSAVESSAEAGRLVAEQQGGKQADAWAHAGRDRAAESHEDSILQVSRLSALHSHAGRNRMDPAASTSTTGGGAHHMSQLITGRPELLQVLAVHS